jgi:hypothetical protein
MYGLMKSKWTSSFNASTVDNEELLLPPKPMQVASRDMFTLDLASVAPDSSVWTPPATDVLRVWPDAYHPQMDNAAWANDPLGPWGGVPSFSRGIKNDTATEPYALNYAFMSLYDHIPAHFDRDQCVLLYNVRARRADADADRKKRNFYAALKYIKHYPTYNEMKDTLGMSEGFFSEQIRPTIFSIAQHINFMDFNVRLWDWNHAAHFQERVLTVTDGFPISISRSSNDFVRRITKSGKYSDFVVKADMMATLCGFPCNYAFTRYGVMHDSKVHKRNRGRCRRMYPWEYSLGDKAYVGCDEFLTEVKGENLSKRQKEWNKLVQHYRGSRSEALIAQLKTPRKTLSTRWRGSLSLLAAVLHISMHMVALEERMRGPRFDHFGPWPAAPRQVVELAV